ncbi:hypothetical protein [Pleionea sediminis]|uniref:hypothetical protein n=1 Tax=Pleionea sediminis TaxID=2569479 RepID=UPI001185361A|nr:hypothetical protein [Pleionea sediminis]
MSETGLAKIRNRYESLETKHRIMVLSVAVVVLLVIFDFFWYQSDDAEQKKLKRQLTNITQERKELSGAIEQRQQELMGSAFNEKRQQVDLLKKQEKELDNQLSRYAQLVSPRQMPGLLKNIFEKSRSLDLIGLEKHPVQPAFKNLTAKKNKGSGESKSTGSDVNFYRHDFTVTLEGRYFELIKSLESLEAMNLKIYWHALDYKVKQYPEAEIKLTIYTFSYDKDWIGA